MMAGEWGSAEWAKHVQGMIDWYEMHLATPGYARSFPYQFGKYRDLADYWRTRLAQMGMLRKTGVCGCACHVLEACNCGCCDVCPTVENRDLTAIRHVC